MSECTYEQCDRKMLARGLCTGHYKQQWEGKPLAPLGARRGRTKSDPGPLFWGKVDKSGDCWEWLGYKSPEGYGRTKILGIQSTHRVAWTLVNGDIPDGLMIDHMCHNRGCVNPAHLQLVTQKQNQENRVSHQPRNIARARGVHKSGDRWRARAKHNGVDISAGTYSTIAEAEAAAIALRKQLFTNNLLDRRVS